MDRSLVAGIDIDHHIIKAVVVKLEKGKCTLVSCKEIQSTQALLSDNFRLNYQEIVKKLQQLKTQLPFFIKNAAVSIPDKSVISREIVVESELYSVEEEPVILHQFSLQSPSPIHDLSIDYVKLDEANSDEAYPVPSSTRYQVYAGHKYEVNDRIKTLSDSGFRPVLIEGESHPMWLIATMIKNDDRLPDCSLFLSFRFSTSVIFSAEDERPFLFKILPLGINHLMDLGVNAFSEALAEKFFRQQHLMADGKTAQLGLKIGLLGEGFNISGLEEALRTALNIQCEFVDISLLAKSKRHRITNDLRRFEHAYGLAIRAGNWLRRHNAA